MDSRRVANLFLTTRSIKRLCSQNRPTPAGPEGGNGAEVEALLAQDIQINAEHTI